MGHTAQGRDRVVGVRSMDDKDDEEQIVRATRGVCAMLPLPLGVKAGTGIGNLGAMAALLLLAAPWPPRGTEEIGRGAATTKSRRRMTTRQSS